MGFMKVERRQFEPIVGNLLQQKPATRDQQKTVTRKHSGKIVPRKPEQDQPHPQGSGTSTENTAPSY
jgi:hypothetical protein